MASLMNPTKHLKIEHQYFSNYFFKNKEDIILKNSFYKISVSYLILKLENTT